MTFTTAKTHYVHKETIKSSITEKYNESKFVDHVKQHIDGTYSGHYANEIQTAEYIMSRAESLDYLRGSVLAYVDRYGKKGGYNDVDLYKAVHYLSMMAFFAEKKFPENKA